MIKKLFRFLIGLILVFGTGYILLALLAKPAPNHPFCDPDDEMLVIVQAETVLAIENLEAIANTPGIDGVFIGPSDLSASMGHVGNVSHPEVVETVGSALRTIRDAGKYAGLLCLDESMVAHFEECGANFVGIGVATLIHGNSARSLAARHKDGDDSSAEAGY